MDPTPFSRDATTPVCLLGVCGGGGVETDHDTQRGNMRGGTEGEAFEQIIVPG